MKKFGTSSDQVQTLRIILFDNFIQNVRYTIIRTFCETLILMFKFHFRLTGPAVKL